jgi:hypothetical protein
MNAKQRTAKGLDLMRHKLALNAERFCRYPMGLVYLRAFCLFLLLNVVTLPSLGQVLKSGEVPSREGLEVRRKLLAPAFKMLKAEGVPFDPKLLLGDDWRSQLEPALARMPAMSQTVRVTEPMKGVYLAGTLLLPEHISLDGDTLILTRELGAHDENSTISITGNHRLFIFNIGDSRKFAAMLKSEFPRDLLNIDVKAPCAVVGIAPTYRGRVRCQGMPYLAGPMRRT